MSGFLTRFSNPENPPPNPWRGLLAGFGLVTLAGVATLVLISMWLSARPANLIPLSETFLEMTEQVLLENEIPAASIVVSEPVFHSNPAAVWHHYEVRALVPHAVDADAIMRGLRDRLEPRHVSLHESMAPDGSWEVQLVHAGAEVATVRLQGAQFEPERKRDYRPAGERLARQVERIVHERLPEEGQLAIMPTEDREDGTTQWKFTRFEAYVPETEAMRDIQRALDGAMAGREVSVETEERADGTERLIRVSYQRYPVVNLLLTPRPPRNLPEIEAPSLDPPDNGISVFDPGALMEPADGGAEAPAPAADPEPEARAEPNGAPRIALIIDDGGEEPEATEIILGLDRALTLAILPDTTGGEELARRAAAMGFELMLHMPMETENANQNYPNSLMTGMTPAELAHLLERALVQVPGAVGINNHTGGAFTADPVSVERLMAHLRTTPLYFVDSRTTADTVAFDAARTHGIPAAQRDVFLDNEPDFDYIEGRFNELLALARQQGTAIGIAHFRPETAEALAALLPRLADEGIHLVPVSELVQ